MISSALDTLLNQVVVEVLHLGQSAMIIPVVATLDPVRKIEILKDRAAHISNGNWKRALTKFLDKVESVFRHRNIACHTPPVLELGKWTLRPFAAAKMMKRIDLKEKN